jgi:hypothetical protein
MNVPVKIDFQQIKEIQKSDIESHINEENNENKIQIQLQNELLPDVNDIKIEREDSNHNEHDNQSNDESIADDEKDIPLEEEESTPTELLTQLVPSTPVQQEMKTNDENEITKTIIELRQKLSIAINNEDYEICILLREQIRTLQQITNIIDINDIEATREYIKKKLLDVEELQKEKLTMKINNSEKQGKSLSNVPLSDLDDDVPPAHEEPTVAVDIQPTLLVPPTLTPPPATQTPTSTSEIETSESNKSGELSTEFIQHESVFHSEKDIHDLTV